ncbi:hypothetical protein LSH36_199g02011 [Paralvinella palmiformis]|uniref:Uncharacterized protein n=1 Tax=Paralvinella palmiformis TaxID=53620 RepID=A0AAD9N6R3_9ANNE|nr:hypothetical protein LSH36_199g02011 [Paralvinella palmiformis]
MQIPSTRPRWSSQSTSQSIHPLPMAAVPLVHSTAKEHSLSDSRNYQWGMTPPSSSKLQRYDCEHPDTTYAMPDTHSCKTETDYNPYDVKVKQEVLSDEELEQEQQTEPEPYRYSRTSLNSNSCLGEEPPAKNSSTRPSPKGILMSLLCEKSPGVQGKKRGRAKKKSDDPLYIPPKQSKSDLSEMVPGTRENKDNRVLIGLTDYLSGFKEGDLSNEKLPRCVFSGPDISAKIRKVVLLNSGPFSTVRMVHRSLQGMRATEINEVMREMTKPRQHADYVGEYKAITMPKVRQWRRLVGVFYKCPPELLKPEALLSHDILLEDYKKFYEQMYKYDRTPKPPYFQAIEMFSPFSGTFSGKRGWREDPTFDPTTRLSEVYTANDLVECTPPEDEEIPASKSDEHPDGPSLQAMGIKSERVDWESADDDQNVASAAISTTQDSASKPVIGSPAQAEENLDSNVEQSAASRKFKASRESTPDDYNPNLVTFVPKNFGQQPVFPQPLIVSEYNNGHSENARELSDQPPSAISGGKQSCKEGRTLDRATELSEAHSASKMMNCSSERDREIAGSKSEEPSDGPRLQNVGIKSEMADRVSASDGNDDDHSLASTTVSTTQQTPTKLENGSPTFGDRDGHAERPAANNRDGHNLRSKKDGYISEPASQQL